LLFHKRGLVMSHKDFNPLLQYHTKMQTIDSLIITPNDPAVDSDI